MKAEKSEVISVYIDSRLKHLAEIAARKQGRKLSQFIRWALQKEIDAEIGRKLIKEPRKL